MPTSLGSGSGVQERGRTARTDSCLAVSWGLCRGPRAGLLGRGGGCPTWSALSPGVRRPQAPSMSYSPLTAASAKVICSKSLTRFFKFGHFVNLKE